MCNSRTGLEPDGPGPSRGRAVPRLSWCGLIAATITAASAAQGPERLPGIDLVNDAHGRSDLALSFDLPRGLPGESLQLRDEEGNVIPLQITRDRRAAFILPRLPAGARRHLIIEPALDRRLRPAVQVVRRQDRVDIEVDERPMLVYRSEKTEPPSADFEPTLRRGGYIHPVLTPQGRLVTDDYPPGHPQHHGIWSAWSKTSFQGRQPDFWNMGNGTGAVEFEAIADTWSGAAEGGVRTRHRYVDLGTAPATTVLLEGWEITAYAVGGSAPAYRLFDLSIRHEGVTPATLHLPQYSYGPLGIRGNRAWNAAGRLQLLTSEGKTRIDGQGSRVRWCHMGGLVGGRPVGIAVLDHPQNARHPQPLRLHPTEPFLSYAPLQLGPMEIGPSETLVSRYRFVVYDGSPDVALLERLWHDFAHPPSITVIR
jgi:hypothetical protein